MTKESRVYKGKLFDDTAGLTELGSKVAYKADRLIEELFTECANLGSSPRETAYVLLHSVLIQESKFILKYRKSYIEEFIEKNAETNPHQQTAYSSEQEEQD